ncbi:MAG: hypothetical protein J7L61_00355 [Thermoplasmata archaeon]|nr:hypothetical protein [Thermoplasmata archaeon]
MAVSGFTPSYRATPPVNVFFLFASVFAAGKKAGGTTPPIGRSSFSPAFLPQAKRLGHISMRDASRHRILGDLVKKEVYKKVGSPVAEDVKIGVKRLSYPEKISPVGL